MPLVAAAVCPHPPLIVPEIAGSAAGELDDLRAACDAAVARLYDAGARSIVVLGTGERTAHLDPPYRGSFAPWGARVAVEVGRQPGAGVADRAGTPDRAGTRDRAGTPDRASVADRAGAAEPDGVAERLPLSLLVGGWLVDRTAPDGPGAGCRMVSVARDEPVERCAALGAGLGASLPWALLVMGDGTACRGEKSPGYADPRAEAYDDRVAAALAGADSDALLDLDPALATELKVAGRSAWQVLAGAVRAAGGAWRGDLSYHAAPYGVAYFVAGWEPAR
ncbi:class III extradiol dioxygenase subunit B-like domain-containing protein [Micromonospora sp. CPCC 206060]|uniref:class III extradiol dioxygenase subunit B-like domain-containing protein n=1 Tax=Micromonospora sp. CPCC 206060 TaxID=3122406 RepID=UPI003FA5A495